jgi:tetratricopeptide (TPR) repeat protein
MFAPLEILCCCAPEDQEMQEELKKHLTLLERMGQIRILSDTNLNLGLQWEKELHELLERVAIILLLISPDFMKSDHCYNKMAQAIERHNQGTTYVIPVLLRATFWRTAPFATLQVVPTDAKPVTNWPNNDDAFQDITEHIDRIVSELQIRRALVEADTHFHNGHYKEALATYKLVLASAPQAHRYEQAGKTCLQLAYYEEALEMYEQAIQTTNEHKPSLYAGKGQALLQLERYDDALPCYQTAIKLSAPDTDPQLYHDLGTLHERLAQRAYAMEQQILAERQPKTEPE